MSKTRLAVLAIAILIILVLTLITVATRETPDQRLAALSKQALQEQSRQNQRLLDGGNQISQAARSLVESDAEARKEILAANAAIQQELQKQQVHLDQRRASIEAAHTELERERRELARQRGRDPIVAESIDTIGTMLACLLPLLLAGYIIFSAHTSSSTDRQVTELLLDDLTAENPRLLPLPSPATPLALEEPGDDPSSEPEPANAGG